MKKIIYILFVVAILTITSACGTPTGKVSLKTYQDSLSYVLGLQIGKSLDQTLTKVDYKMFVRAMKDAGDETKIALSEEEIYSILDKYQEEAQVKMMQKHDQDAEKNKKEQEQFFKENSQKEGVILLDGLQYKIIEEGTGKTPAANDEVEIEFVGKTISGKVFWNSSDSIEPIIAPVSDLLLGWSIALQNMKEGARWELFLPDSLAFGEYGIGDVGPSQAVIFELYLKAIK